MVVLINSDAFRNDKMESCYVEVAKALSRSNRCIVLTGAGISCAAGIPDFRSKNGLYNLLKEKNPTKIVKGQDLFDANLFRSPEATNIFYRFMGEFKDMIGNCKYTSTHSFIKRLHDSQKLLRCYTQNIDDLEVGLTLNTALKPDPQQAQVVQLHGTMSRVICTLAPNNHIFDFSAEYAKGFRNGEPPNCPTCVAMAQDRIEKGKRRVSSGTLRPDIVLYNEPHPLGDVIGKLQTQDIRKRPDFLLIMGTSLKIPGCKTLVKEVAKKVHEFKNGKVVFVNLTEVGSEWDGIIDYHFQCTTDNWVHKVEPLFLQLYKPKSEVRTLPRYNSAVVSRSKNDLDLELCDDTFHVPQGSAFSPVLASPISPLNHLGSPAARSLIRSSSAMPNLSKIRPFDYIPSQSIEDLELMDDESALALQSLAYSTCQEFATPDSILAYDSDTSSEKTSVLSYDSSKLPVSRTSTESSTFVTPNNYNKPTKKINQKNTEPPSVTKRPRETRNQFQPTPLHLRKRLQAMAEERKKEVIEPIIKSPLKKSNKSKAKSRENFKANISKNDTSDKLSILNKIHDEKVNVVTLPTIKKETNSNNRKSRRCKLPIHSDKSTTSNKADSSVLLDAIHVELTPESLGSQVDTSEKSSAFKLLAIKDKKASGPKKPTFITRMLPQRSAAASARTVYSFRARSTQSPNRPAKLNSRIRQRQ